MAVSLQYRVFVFSFQWLAFFVVWRVMLIHWCFLAKLSDLRFSEWAGALHAHGIVCPCCAVRYLCHDNLAWKNVTKKKWKYREKICWHSTRPSPMCALSGNKADPIKGALMLNRNKVCREQKVATWRTRIFAFAVVGLSAVYFSLGASAVTILGEDDDSARDASFSYCGSYVKPATCMSHSECRWTGSCVPR